MVLTLKGEKVLVRRKDGNKKKSEGVWMRSTVVSQEGAMVLFQLPTVLLRMNQSKVRSDHDEWRDVQIPHLEGPPQVEKSGSSHEEVACATESFVSEYEVCYHLCCNKGSVDCVEVIVNCSGIGAYLSHQGQAVASPVDFQFSNRKNLQQSIAVAWKKLVRHDSSRSSYMQSLQRIFFSARSCEISVPM